MYEPYATEADAHREWHRNTGVPIGTPGCPQDACHDEPDYDGNEGWTDIPEGPVGPARPWVDQDVF